MKYNLLFVNKKHSNGSEIGKSKQKKINAVYRNVITLRVFNNITF